MSTTALSTQRASSRRRAQRRVSSSRDTMSRDQARPMRIMNQLQAKELIYTRKIGATEFTVSTNVSGVIALTTIGSSASVSSAPDFASCAVLYQLYRVRALVLQLFPTFPVNTTAVTVPALVYVCPFFSGNSVTSIQGHIDATGTKFLTGYGTKREIITVDYRRDPEAHFWTPVSSAIPSNEAFGLTMVGTNLASTASTAVFRTVLHWIVEFKMAS